MAEEENSFHPDTVSGASSVRVYFCLSACVCVCVFLYMPCVSVRVSIVYLSICLSVFLYIHLFVCPSVCLCVYLSLFHISGRRLKIVGYKKPSSVVRALYAFNHYVLHIQLSKEHSFRIFCSFSESSMITDL